MSGVFSVITLSAGHMTSSAKVVKMRNSKGEWLNLAIEEDDWPTAELLFKLLWVDDDVIAEIKQALFG